MKSHQEQIDDFIKRLADIPTLIVRHTTGWSSEQVRTAPAHNEWTALDILAHLRAADDILTSRIYMVLVRDNAPLPAYDERRWTEIARYSSGDFASSLNLFALRRAEVVAVLQSMNYEDWERIGTHEVLGQISVFDIVRGLVEHEEEHCRQLEKIVWN
ncbi:MAG: DinB family protein [Ktedonobacteraceae bacterium]